MRTDRYAVLLIAIAGFACFQLVAQPPPLVVDRRGDSLHVTAPRLHFLEGKPMEQLHNGASVSYEFELTLIADSKNKPAFRRRERFIVSYDLWEERFSVVQAGPPARSGSHLTAIMAEGWCLDNLTIPLPPSSSGTNFVIKLTCRVAENDVQSGVEANSSLTLAGLIDVFSRKGRDIPLRWEATSAPFRPAELKDSGKIHDASGQGWTRHGLWEPVPIPMVRAY